MNKNLKESRREYFTAFLRDYVFEHEDFNKIDWIEQYMTDHVNEDTWDFCEYLDLGSWFEYALTDCDFDVKAFLKDLRSEWEKEAEEAINDQAEIDRDLRQAQGWRH